MSDNTLPHPSESSTAPATHHASHARSVLLAAGVGLLFDGYAVNVYALTIAIVAVAYHTQITNFTLAATLFLVGYAIGSTFFGHIADWLGRRRALGISIAGYGLATALTGLASSVPVLSGFRFLTGVGGGGELTVGAPYSDETVRPRRRAVGIGTFLAFYPVGILLSIGIIKATSALGISWQWDYAFAALPAILILVFRMRVEESRRLTNVKNLRAAAGQPQVQLWQAVRNRRILVNIIIGGCLLIFPLYYAFYVNTLYGEKYWGTVLHNPVGSYLSWDSLIMVVWVAASITVGLLADWLGYRLIGITMFILGLVGYGLAYSGLAGTGTTQWVIGQCIAQIGLGGGWAVVNSHVSSAFQTEIRSAGFGWSSGLARILTIFCPTITTAIILGVGIHAGVDTAALVCILGIIGFILVRERRGVVEDDLVTSAEKKLHVSALQAPISER